MTAFVIELWNYQKPSPISEINEGITRRIIRIEAEGYVLHYQETLFWEERKWAEILADKSGFSSYLIEEFKRTYEVNADNFSVEFLEGKKSTFLMCDVHGKFNGNWYDFHWFLDSLGLDFLDSPFNKSERTLSWEGSIDGIPTSIVLEFPFSIENCHAHVWSK
ncbi:MAG: hypothetical protein J7K51_11350 [Thermotogae bacterium]|nr:hypothetical protein [Thermotogota bacterium]